MTGKRQPRLSTPRESGGLVTLGGATILGAAQAPVIEMALCASVIIFAVYLARGPIEQRVGKGPWRPWDRIALAVYAALAVGLTVVIAGRAPLEASTLAVIAGSFPIVGAIARTQRKHRTIAVELAGMAACGATAGLTALAGGARIGAAIVAGVAMAGYAAAAVPLVRGEVRKYNARRRARLTHLGVGLTVLAAGSFTLTLHLTGAPMWAAVAWAPRAVHAVGRALIQPKPLPIYWIAGRETAELTVFVALVALLA